MWMLASLLVTVICLCGLLKKRFEEMLAPVTMTAVLVLYALSFWQKMLWFPWISYAACAAAFGLLIWRSVRTKGQTLLTLCKNVFTPGMAAFAVLTVVLFRPSMKQIVLISDDIRFWGLQAHSVWAHNGLTDAAHHLSPRFMTYTPGMPLFQWLGLYACGEWNEGVAYVMRAVFSLILIVPFAGSITWKRVWMLPVFAVFAFMLPTIWGGSFYDTLMIDGILGLAFGYCMMCMWRTRLDRAHADFHLLCAALGMCVLTLLKQAGVAWALLAVVLLLLVLRPWKESGTAPWKAALVSLSPLLTLGSWQLFVNIQHFSGGHYSKTLDNLQALMTGRLPFAEASEGLLRSFAAMMTAPLISPESGVVFRPALLVWLLLFAALPVLAACLHREHERQLKGISIWFAVSLAAFFAGYALILMTAFQGAGKSEDGLWLIVLDCERYFMPMVIGTAMLLIGHLLEVSCSGHPNAKKTGAVLAALLVFMLPCMRWTQTAAFLDPNAEARDTELFWELDEVNYWRYDLEEPQNAVVLYGMMPATFNHEHLQYVTAPVKLVMHDNQELDEEGFARILRDNQVTHLICIDDYNLIYEQAQNFSEDGWVDVHTLYEVSWEDDVPVLYAY